MILDSVRYILIGDTYFDTSILAARTLHVTDCTAHTNHDAEQSRFKYGTYLLEYIVRLLSRQRERALLALAELGGLLVELLLALLRTRHEAMTIIVGL